jgi:hypothetical protein
MIIRMNSEQERIEHAHGPTPDAVLDPDDAHLLAERLKLLSDPSRLRIEYALVEGAISA